MSVPLDRLYNFLDDITSRDDTLIYRFFPHGSRKISDLMQFTNKTREEVMKNFRPKFTICNDQEPLDFEFYASDESADDFNQANGNIYEKEYARRLIKLLNFKSILGVYTQKIPVILIHSEKRSDNLVKYEQIKCIGVYWWAHGLISLDWFRYANLDPALTKRNVSYDFLIYNRAWSGTREYRIKFAELLVEYGVVDHCLTWFSVTDGCHYTQHKFKNLEFAVTNTQLEQHYKSSTADSTASADYCSNDYNSTQIEIVLETLFDDKRLHLTEKSLRPIACGQPFILAATHGSLEYLRSYGFETFDGLIDETYDTVHDPVERLQSICREMKRINQLPLEQKAQLFIDLRKIAQRNKQIFFSPDWQQHVIDEFKTNFDLAIDQIFG
jgi:hypothetical protein